MAELKQDITTGPLLSAYVEASFDEGLKILQENGYRLISLEENARLRIQEGPKSFISQNGNWVLEDAVYIPKKGKFLTKFSHITKKPREATQDHRYGTDFYLTNEQVEQCLANCVELNKREIPTNRFGENEITRYAFGEIADRYGNFLRANGINELSIWLADMQDKPFVRKVSFAGLGDGMSYWNGDDAYLYDYSRRVRGVRKNK